MVSMSLALTSETAAKITQFQVALLRGASVDCGSVMGSCVKKLGVSTVPFADGAKVLLASYTQGQAAVSLSAEVDAGTYTVAVEALDASGLVVANACQLDVILAEGAPRSVPMVLAPAAGTCDGLLSP